MKTVIRIGNRVEQSHETGLERISGKVSRTDKMDYWKNSNQRKRWVAHAFSDIESALRRIRGYRDLPALHYAL